MMEWMESGQHNKETGHVIGMVTRDIYAVGGNQDQADSVKDKLLPVFFKATGYEDLLGAALRVCENALKVMKFSEEEVKYVCDTLNSQVEFRFSPDRYNQ